MDDETLRRVIAKRVKVAGEGLTEILSKELVVLVASTISVSVALAIILLLGLTTFYPFLSASMTRINQTMHIFNGLMSVAIILVSSIIGLLMHLLSYAFRMKRMLLLDALSLKNSSMQSRK